MPRLRPYTQKIHSSPRDEIHELHAVDGEQHEIEHHDGSVDQTNIQLGAARLQQGLLEDHLQIQGRLWCWMTRDPVPPTTFFG